MDICYLALDGAERAIDVSRELFVRKVIVISIPGQGLGKGYACLINIDMFLHFKMARVAHGQMLVYPQQFLSGKRAVCITRKFRFRRMLYHIS